jgi:hypothetical protein
MAGRVAISPVSFNAGAGGTAFPALPPATPGYDTGSPGGTFTAWGSNNGVMIPNNGLIILVYWCGATAGGISEVLIGQTVGTTGQVLPHTTQQFTITASSSGWLGPWNMNTYNISNVNANFGSPVGGAVAAAAQGSVCVDFTTTTTLAVRAYQVIQA